MSLELGGAKSPSVPRRGLVLVPLGSTEQHGPHLPLDTDTAIATAVAIRVADLLGDPNVRVAPPITYGASGEHQNFAGTSSIGTAALCELLVELTRSMRTWCARVVFVNGHGGNVPALADAIGKLRLEGHDVTWVSCASEAQDAHAGRTETSLMLHLTPWSVRVDLALAGNKAPIKELMPKLIKGGVAAVSPNGVLGDPAGASAAEGRRLLEQMATRIVLTIRSAESDVQRCPSQLGP